jgi:hypothetical protein
MKLYEKYLKESQPKAYKKGDIVSFHNDLGKMSQGQITNVKGDTYTITVHGIKFNRKFKDIYIKEDKWSGSVQTKWHPPEGTFTKSAEEIADVLANASDDLGQAMSRLDFYINRSGGNLSAERLSVLNSVKDLLRGKFKNKK